MRAGRPTFEKGDPATFAASLDGVLAVSASGSASSIPSRPARAVVSASRRPD
jgi:hypothetical protein